MLKSLLIASLLSMNLTSEAQAQYYANPNPAGFTLAVHGGAGTITRQHISPEVEANYRAALERALQAGYQILAQGGSSIAAVEAVVRVFEDDPLFNAGKGAVFTHDGKNELDASIMDGKTGLAGAVAGVTSIKNPISAARAVMEKTRHVMLIGRGAEQFAAEQKLEIVDPAYFFTQWRWDQLQRAKEKNRLELDHNAKPEQRSENQSVPYWQTDYKHGTVGAVALDSQGNLAAATSTGGMTNKLYGRVGDSPIIGAGTYAENGVVAVSGTGTGEFFIRSALAYDIAARIKYGKLDLAQAVDQTIQAALQEKHGDGGVISLDPAGNVKFGFNTEGMYRGLIRADGKALTMIFK